MEMSVPPGRIWIPNIAASAVQDGDRNVAVVFRGVPGVEREAELTMTQEEATILATEIFAALGVKVTLTHPYKQKGLRSHG